MCEYYHKKMKNKNLETYLTFPFKTIFLSFSPTRAKIEQQIDIKKVLFIAFNSPKATFSIEIKGVFGKNRRNKYHFKHYADWLRSCLNFPTKNILSLFSVCSLIHVRHTTYYNSYQNRETTSTKVSHTFFFLLLLIQPLKLSIHITCPMENNFLNKCT